MTRAPSVADDGAPLMVRVALAGLAWVTGWCIGTAFVLAGAL